MKVGKLKQVVLSKGTLSEAVMHDSDSGIGTDSGMIPFLAGIGIGIGIKKTELYYIVVKFQSPIYNTFRDMTFF